MTKINLKKEVFAILQELGIAPQAITIKANFCKDLGLDSLDFAELVMEFERRFNIEIPAMEAENIETVQQAITYLEAYMRPRLGN